MKETVGRRKDVANQLLWFLREYDLDRVSSREIRQFPYDLPKTHEVRLSAPEGMHDDTVCALALAYWGINKRRVWEFD